MEKEKLAIIGWHEGSAGQVHSWLEDSSNFCIEFFIHPYDHLPEIQKIPRKVSQFSYPEEGTFKGIPLKYTSEWITFLKEKNINNILISNPDPHERFELLKEAKRANLNLINAIHPTVTIMPEAILGKNIILHARSFVGYRAELNDGVIVNTGSQIDHHCYIDESVTIDPAVRMAGNVTIEKKSIVHTGATIINKITVGESSIIGAGTVVIKNVNQNSKVVGVPAREI